MMLNQEQIEKSYLCWCEKAVLDPDLSAELSAMEHTPERIEDAFFDDLAFGTGGLRGVIGAGTRRMNIYTVARATVGLADYLADSYSAKTAVAIGYDTRIKSREFAEIAARVLAARGITVWIYDRPLPTPMLSFAVRALHAQAGIMITASHNPAVYNGYKVYGEDGCQITTAAADAITERINARDYFDCIPSESYEIMTVPDAVYTEFLDTVSGLSLLYGDAIDRNVSVVYTPLCGTGLEPVTDILKKNGFESVTLVSEQAKHDGNFPTCPFPNPELPEAMQLGLSYAERVSAELLLATDPDCDRVGVAVRTPDGYRLLTGNEVGVLLLDYICTQREKHGRMPKDPVCIKTIVTTDLAEAIARDHGVTVDNVLTGFKFIGEKIGGLEARGELSRYLFGFEESCGYLSSPHARDKDGVNAAYLIVEMSGVLKARGESVHSRLCAIYEKYGYTQNTLWSYYFEGASGIDKMNGIMHAFRTQVKAFGGRAVTTLLDYEKGLDGLPKSDVLKFFFDGGSIVVRPSGTEPKLKIYISVSAESERAAQEKTDAIRRDAEAIMNA